MYIHKACVNKLDDVAGQSGTQADGRRLCPSTDDCPARVVPPGSSALREFCRAIEDALTLAAPATTKDELTYLRVSRDRARAVLLGCKRVLANQEIDDRDLLAIVVGLRDLTSQLSADQYAPNSLTW